MSLVRTVPPASLPVSLPEFKAHARVTESDEDAVMTSQLRAAVQACEEYTGLGLITQTWVQTWPAFPATGQPSLRLGRRPVQAVLGVQYLDEGLATQTLATSVYRVNGIGWDIAPATIGLAVGGAWPTVYGSGDAVTVTYRVGFGDSHTSVPELIRHAIYMTAASFFGFREDVIMGSTVADLPFASKNLLRGWRPLAVA